MTLESLVSAATVVALVIGATAALHVLWLHLRAFKMVVREVRHVATDNATHLVALRVAFVNPAAGGRTVSKLKLYATKGQYAIDAQHLQGTLGSNQHELLFALPNHPTTQDMPLSLLKTQVLEVPLDIPPYQSRYLWLPLYVIPTMAQVGERVLKFHLKMDAQDVFGKRLSRVDEVFELRDYEVLSAEENRERNDAIDRAI